MPPAGLEAVFLANRDRLLRFLLVRGAGDSAEDLLQDLWIRISASATGPVTNPVAYLFRAADMLMIDRYRSRKRSEQRERDWMDSDGAADGDASLAASSEREIGARQELVRVAAVLKALGPRRETVFRRARIDGISQPRIAEELGVSLSTVESDLRTACRALAELRETLR